MGQKSHCRDAAIRGYDKPCGDRCPPPCQGFQEAKVNCVPSPSPCGVFAGRGLRLVYRRPIAPCLQQIRSQSLKL